LKRGETPLIKDTKEEKRRAGERSPAQPPPSSIIIGRGGLCLLKNRENHRKGRLRGKGGYSIFSGKRELSISGSCLDRAD